MNHPLHPRIGAAIGDEETTRRLVTEALREDGFLPRPAPEQPEDFDEGDDSDLEDLDEDEEN